MDEQQLLHAALAYARLGWAVFPCHPRTKQPLVRGDIDPATGRPIPGSGGLKKATTDEAQIRDWWHRFPKAMIGLPTGRNIGAFVIDIDAELTGEPGQQLVPEALLYTLETTVGASLPPTWRSRTPRGGWHLFLAMPVDGEVHNRAGIVQRVDVRGEGGYVIVPPSVRSDGRAYAWEIEPGDTTLGNASEALLKFLAALREPDTDQPSHRKKPSAAYGEAALAQELAALRNAADGTRNESLFKSSIRLGQLVAAGLVERSTVQSALEVVAAGWPNIRKSRGTITSGLERGLREPRAVAPASPERRHEATTKRSEGTADAIGAMFGLYEAEQRALDGQLQLFSQTDLGNAERFARRLADRLIWVPGKGWFFWDSGRWSRDESDAKVQLAAQYVARTIQSEAESLRGTEQDTVVEVRYRGTKHEQPVFLSDKLAAWGRVSEDHRHLSAMVRQAAPKMAVEAEQLDSDPHKINVRNGTLIVERRALDCDPISFVDHDPADYITKMVDADFDPDASCPTYDAFLQTVQPEIANRRFLNQWGGLSLTGDISEQKLVFFWGKGRNGKTTLLEAWAHVLGDYACSLPIETFMDSGRARSGGQATPDLALLPGARFVHTDEPARNARLSESLVKLLTGGDTIQARELNKGFFSFRPCFKLTMSGNYRPKIDGGEASQGIWRRLILIRWGVTIPDADVDKQLAGKLRNEGSGILNRLLDGLRDWIDRGLQIPPEVNETTEDYRIESDLLGRFLSECTVADESSRVSNGELYALFIAWAKSNGEALWRKKGLTRAMQERGYIQARGEERYWTALRATKSVREFEHSDADPEMPDTEIID